MINFSTNLSHSSTVVVVLFLNFGLTYAISLCPNKLSEVTKIIVRLGWNWQPIKIVDEFLVHICTVGIHPELDQLFDMVQGNLILFKLKPYNILAKLKKENSK